MNDSRLFLSIFFLASGILVHFALPFDAKFPILICLLSALCFIRYKWVIFAFIFGFFYATLRTDLVDTKLLRHNQHNVEISGVIENLDYTERTQRIFLRTDDNMLFRISVPTDSDCAIGKTAYARANLYAPQSNDAFNDFNYARWSFFNGLSGSGKAENSTCGSGEKSLRDRLHFKMKNSLADALVLGYKNSISRADYDRVRASGISHVFSISGFHFALIGAWIFFITNFFVKLFPKLTRRVPSRNIALPITCLGIGFYLLLSGTDVVTVRSFVMVCLGFLAVIMDRKVLTLRNAALVFCLMLLVKPFWLMTAGFQLSFAAVFGLLIFFANRKIEGGGIKKFFYATFMSSVVATIWTMPFIMKHFGYFPIYGILGNVILLPIFSIAIMPIVMIGALTSLFGWSGLFAISDYFYKIVLDVADWIGRFPYAMINLGMPPLFLIFLGLFFYLIEKKKIAWVLFLVSILIAILTPVPILRTTMDGEVIGFTQNGETYYNVGYSENHPFIIPRKDRLKADCKKGLCEYKTKNWTAVSMQKFMPVWKNLSKLCSYDFIISYLPLELPECQNKVISGSVKIYQSGKVQKIAPITY